MALAHSSRIRSSNRLSIDIDEEGQSASNFRTHQGIVRYSTFCRLAGFSWGSTIARLASASSNNGFIDGLNDALYSLLVLRRDRVCFARCTRYAQMVVRLLQLPPKTANR